MKNNNKGYSLVELIVTMAIMAVLTSMLFIGLGILPRNAAKSCAEGLKTVVGQTRIMTMGKSETILEIFQDADGVYYTRQHVDGVADTAAEECGKSYVTIYYHMEDPAVNADTVTIADCVELTSANPLYLGFNRGNGKMTAVEGTVFGVDVTSIVCDMIIVEGGGLERRVRIYPATGKVTLDS